MPPQLTGQVLWKLILFLVTLGSLLSHQLAAQDGQANKEEASEEVQQEDIDRAASTSHVTILNASSHKIIASGWPTTSQMWPSIETADGDKTMNSSKWLDHMEPFIYADKPRSLDYSLLLKMNDTILDILKTHRKPMQMNLSFEYYFNYDQKISALPGIKIEVDRKQFKYIEPTSAMVRSRIWIKFIESISITDHSFDSADWLKFSLVNRQAPSLVAIRRLKVEFYLDDRLINNSTPAPNTSDGGAGEKPPKLPVTTTPAPVPGAAVVTPPGPTQLPSKPSPPVVSTTVPAFSLNPTPPPRQQPTQDVPFPQAPDFKQTTDGYEPAASNLQPTTIKPNPVWNIWNKIGGRKKRDTSTTAPTDHPATNVTTQLPDKIELTCFYSDHCDWTLGQGEEKIQWSLARMPPATSEVQNGYYYVSNRNNYGNRSSLLELYLNQTESATLADQNSDHCIELALFITERTILKLYQLQRKSSGNETVWARGNSLITWSPTLSTAGGSQAAGGRTFLPHSKLSSMEAGQHGWTYETLCFGHFFTNHKECSDGNCGFGFEMVPDGMQRPASSLGAEIDSPASLASSIEEQEEEQSSKLQVVGISLLREFALNVPGKQDSARWLESWQRPEVEPIDNWRFYPKQEYSMAGDSVTLLGMHDSAIFYMESDWLHMEPHLSFSAILVLESNSENSSHPALNLTYPSALLDGSGNEQLQVFTLNSDIRLVDSNFSLITNFSSSFHWNINDNSTIYNLTLHVSEQLAAHIPDQHARESGLFKLVLEFNMDTHLLQPGSVVDYLVRNNNLSYKISVANVSLSDRCFPNPCQYGQCQQNGTNVDDWTCQCDERHRGRRCEYGRWCNLAHVTPWVGPSIHDSGKMSTPPVTLKISSQQARQPKLAIESVTRVSGRDFCQRKLGPGFKCIDLDVPLNDNLYVDEDKTFMCTCQEDYYLSDDSRCRQAHQCNSLVCSSIGMICDESKPFNRTQPCHCNDKQDWFEDAQDPNKCIRRQCHDKERDCGFDAHICLPTLPGEKPICKCGPKFVLKVNEKGQNYCHSAACSLPTLNDCQHLCIPDNSNFHKPYTCGCHPGYKLAADERSCVAQRPHMAPHCRPACNDETQICTDVGCRCKQGYIGEGELKIQHPKNKHNPTNSTYYTQPIKCLNVCELSYAENKEEFERIESVCPLGLCDKSSFQCRCSDPSSSALIHSKYEPIYANSSASSESGSEDASERKRVSPLCHLRRVCDVDSSSYKICRAQGAICVPDYTKAAMFDCICPPSTNKRFYGQETSSEFTCEPKCSSKKNDCLRRQSVCKLVDKNEVKCECLPGLIFNQQDQRCYLAKYSYSFNLLIVNRYYDSELKFHKTLILNSTLSDPGSYLLSEEELDNSIKAHVGDTSSVSHHHPISGQPKRSMFMTEYNQCNISQVIPKSVIEDPYEHNMDSFLGYIDQCNEKIHQNVRTYHLNSKLGEDIRQSLRQHLRDFTVITSNSSCTETDQSGMFLNCTVYLQSNEPIQASTIEYVMNNCDQNGYSDHYCWIKPRLLLKKPEHQEITTRTTGGGAALNESHLGEVLNYRQIVPCELENFCGPDAYSVRLDEKTSLCSCKCPGDIEIVDVKDLEPRTHDDDLSKIAVKEVCAPRNHCGANSTYCASKVGSVCLYDIRLGTRCNCVYPSYEDTNGNCVEVTFTQLDNTLIVLIVILGTGLIVSIGINLFLVSKSRSLFGKSKQYPLSEFSPPPRSAINRSTGVPNPVFEND